MRERFTVIFVTKPIGFILFQMLGIVAFLWVCTMIKVPFYKTVEVTLEQEEQGVFFDLRDQSFCDGRPVYIYESREKQLEKIESYEMQGGMLYLADYSFPWEEGTKLKMDIQLGEKTLLEIIFRNGGNA